MKEIQLSHKDNTHITTISEFELKQILLYAENWSGAKSLTTETRNVENTIKFLRISLNL